MTSSLGLQCKTIDGIRKKTGATIHIKHNEQLVLMKGTQMQVQQAQRKIERLCQKGHSTSAEDEDACCLLCNEEKGFTVSLCNHRLCFPCAKRYLDCWLVSSAPPEFPICCPGCPDPLLLEDIDKFLGGKSELPKLLQRSFKQYLQANNEPQYLPCKHKNCPGVHSREKDISWCSECSSLRCLRCSYPAEFHEGSSACPFQNRCLVKRECDNGFSIGYSDD